MELRFECVETATSILQLCLDGSIGALTMQMDVCGLRELEGHDCLPVVDCFHAQYPRARIRIRFQ